MRHRPTTRPLAASLLGILLLGGCSWMNDYKGPPPNAMGPTPQVKIMQTADATWIKPTETNPVEHAVPAPSNADQDSMSRLSTLEHQVQAMQTDMSSLMPVLTQMIAVQTNIQTMLAHLQASGTLPPGSVPPPTPAELPPVVAQPVAPVPPPVAANDTNANGSMNAMAATGDNAKAIAPLAPLASAPPPPSASPPPLTPPAAASQMPTPVIPPPDKMAAASATPAIVPPPAMSPPATTPPTTGKMIEDVRVGEHPGTTRIVVDVSDKVAFSNDLDNDEHILTIDVKGAGWKGPNVEKKIGNSPLLVSWQTQTDGAGGTRIIMQLSKTAKIAHSDFLPVGHDQPARIILDLAAN